MVSSRHSFVLALLACCATLLAPLQAAVPIPKPPGVDARGYILIDHKSSPHESRQWGELAGRYQGQLAAYRHEGFWQPMDTLRERNLLQAHWESGKAPWKVW